MSAGYYSLGTTPEEDFRDPGPLGKARAGAARQGLSSARY